MNPVIPRKRANTQNDGAKAEAKLKTQQRQPQMKSGYFLPNLSDMLLTKMLPMKNPKKITEVEMNPNEPRLQTRSNCRRSCHNTRKLMCLCWSTNQGQIVSDGPDLLCPLQAGLHDFMKESRNKTITETVEKCPSYCVCDSSCVPPSRRDLQCLFHHPADPSPWAAANTAHYSIVLHEIDEMEAEIVPSSH